ncbi:chromatin assembly factor 1 subunit A-like isoform X2 [Coccinella septempunctata]|uniref:chromatin assembly factor 1 subunit A-like isoform X2 n=1 Tax=Coccinella septempunctata TaxID=41139 RepID=UPI001D09292C|nr:chromatin assembly factor 1 subunit A-like isoform X2 [Coccinella septempunctata]
MFGLSFSGQLIQGSAERTWNCISQIANLVWYKFNNHRQTIMPRPRRKHHSRSRSRSHSHDKDRDAKRRKIEQYDSPNHKRSVSPPNDPNKEQPDEAVQLGTSNGDDLAASSHVIISDSESEKSDTEASAPLGEDADETKPSETNITPSTKNIAKNSEMNCGASKTNDDASTTPVSNSVRKLFEDKTPTRRLTPKQLEKKLESEKKRQLKEKEKEEREKQRQLEKEQKEAEKQKKKEQKQKEIEMKQKELERKQKEKEEKEEQKRQEKELKLKQKEEEKMRKQQEIEEKNKEKLKEEEKKQKAAAAFVSFFVPKKVNDSDEKKIEETTLAFLPFEVKCDMKLPPPRREPLTSDEKNNLEELVVNNKTDCSYLEDLKSTKPRTCQKTWINEDSDEEVIVVEDEVLLGETICETKPKTERMKVKLLQFHENQRPAYYGTWRKKSKNITGRRPWGKEDIFDYEVDSDDDWEEEEQGENLEVMSDEEKENEPENDDYEVDNEFFVPHGHLSDDEIDDEEHARMSPESQKQKLKLLKDAFDLDIKSKTQKIKPRSIGCIWYNRDGDNVDEAIHRYLKPLNIIINGRIEIRKRDLVVGDANSQKKKKPPRPLPENLMRILAKLVHGNVKKRDTLAVEFLDYIQTNNLGIELSKTSVSKHISQMAKWTWNASNKTHRWIVSEELADKYNIDFALPDVPETVGSNASDPV